MRSNDAVTTGSKMTKDEGHAGSAAAGAGAANDGYNEAIERDWCVSAARFVSNRSRSKKRTVDIRLQEGWGKCVGGGAVLS